MIKFGRLAVPAVAVGVLLLLFVDGAALYGILLVSVGVGLLAMQAAKRGATAAITWPLVAGLGTAVIALAVSAFFVRTTDAYAWTYGQDVKLQRPAAGSSDIAHGIGECSHRGDVWNCALTWIAGEQVVNGRADISQDEFAGNGSIPARAIGSGAVSVGAHPTTVGSQLALGAVPLWVALVGLLGDLVAAAFILRDAAAQRPASRTGE